MPIGRGLVQAGNKKIVYGAVALLIIFYAIFANVFVALAAAGAGVQEGFNFLNVAYVYLILAFGGLVFFPIAGFQMKIAPISLILVEYTVIGLAIVFGITASIGLIETSNSFQIFTVAAQSAAGTATNVFSTVNLITNPVFYSTWIFSNGAIEEVVFVPFYVILRRMSQSGGLGAIIAADLGTASTFSLLHYVKEELIYNGTLPTGAWLFLVAAFFVRIGLNHLADFSHMIAPSMIAHGGFDFTSNFLAGVRT